MNDSASGTAGLVVGGARPATSRLILVAGATGYIGGRLVPRLLERGHRVRCLVRDPARLDGRPWRDAVQVVRGDVLDPASLAEAMRGVHAAYYLVHSMAAGADFHHRDRQAARNFARAADAAGVARIIYLGGLARAQAADLSEHLRSRLETGDVLRSARAPVTEFRASVIVGAGSASFEIVRYLTERVPIMICPRWVYTRTQPIGAEDVLAYLVATLDQPESAGRIVEIGGADVLTYGEMMTEYARARGLRRWLVPVPVLTPRLSSYWVNLVTPIPAAIARPLIDGLRNESVVRDDEARRLFPHIAPASYGAAMTLALAGLEAGAAESAWSDALSSSEHTSRDATPLTHAGREGLLVERRQRSVAADAATVFAEIVRLGGKRGWLYLDWAWRLRGFIDRLFGGVGLRRGRRDPDSLRVGDALDFWRVDALEAGRTLCLRAEMRVPGKAWLHFDVVAGRGGTLLSQTAIFAPRGLLGWLYWYVLYPIHALIFSGLITRLAERAEDAA